MTGLEFLKSLTYRGRNTNGDWKEIIFIRNLEAVVGTSRYKLPLPVSLYMQKCLNRWYKVQLGIKKPVCLSCETVMKVDVPEPFWSKPAEKLFSSNPLLKALASCKMSEGRDWSDRGLRTHLCNNISYCTLIFHCFFLSIGGNCSVISSSLQLLLKCNHCLYAL